MSALLILAGRPEPNSTGKRRRSGYSAEALSRVDRVLEQVAKRHGLAPESVRTSRCGAAVKARREWLVLVQNTWALSSVETGRLCGVDPTSVLLAQKHAGVPTL